jgi:hypothetical protein
LINLVFPTRIAKPILAIEALNRMNDNVLANTTFKLLVHGLIIVKTILLLCKILSLQE